ncbi:cation-translocating P-type ATPase [Actinomadura sp. DC4]|uniref:cation-translocating P-type ATPase n=1 Tax=Actinomadura sp. DC4 TaxID=3055069 RepID=UPI0025B0750C|nr:cation-translocating P-type ATPase [Actinomadura sp. DC4]MDN3356956.1 cation-translocating P-type ATPase [Actinomadura sp. DC4]
MPLRRLLGSAIGLPGTAMRTVSIAVSGAMERRQVHRSPGRTRIRVRGVDRPGTEAAARSLTARLLEVIGVTRAEVNGPLGLVMVLHGDETPLEALLDVIEAFEALHGLDDEPFSGGGHQASHQTVVREMALIGAYLTGGGAAVAGRFFRAAPLPVLPPGVATLAAMADAAPQVRARLERSIGRPATDLVLGSGVAVTHALAYQPSGPIINSMHRLIRVVEMRGHLKTWDRCTKRLAPVPGAFAADPFDVPPRPVPLPYGPVERAAWVIPAAITAAIGTYALGQDAGRAQGVLAAGVPKAARLGRDAFAAQLGMSASRHDVAVAEPDALRRLDRVNQVVIDASALRTGDLTIEEVVLVSDAVRPEEAYEHAHTLVDVRRLSVRHEDGAWAVEPLRSTTRLPGGTQEQAAAMRDGGATVLVLTCDGEPVALVPVVVELDPMAESVIALARRACPVAVAGAAAAMRRRLPVEQTVPGGSRLLNSIRTLQEDGRTVMLISARGGAALAAADIGIGLVGPGGHPPWGAHILCGPGGLRSAYSLVDALLPARDASSRAARIAEVGSAAGALLAATGTPQNAARRAQLAIDMAALSALATGTWAGLAAARRPVAVPADRTPWHAWPAQAVLDRLDSTSAGISATEAEHRRTRAGNGAPAAPGLARVVVEELDNPLTPALAAGAGVSAVVGSVTDAALIGAVLGVNALMSGVQRVGADRALRQLVDLSAVRVRLRRPQTGDTDTTAERLVPGDVVMLSAGDAVPADLRLLAGKGLEVDESSLTGESQLVTKSARPSVSQSVADRTSMLYEGTVIAAGEATGVVVATGDRTEIGRAVQLVGERRPGGVESRLQSLTRVTLPVALGAGAGLFLTDLMRGRPLAQALGPAVSLAVAAVPEGLPFVATAAELATARRLSRRGALVRNPATIEALGRVDILCFDKTGTLTIGKLRLRLVSDGESSTPVTELSPFRRVIVAAALRASPEQVGRRLPHPTDRAIIRAAKKLGMKEDEGFGAWKRVDEMPFEPARGFHAVLGRTPDGQILSVKGAPEIVLDRCGTWRRGEGSREFDARAREKVEQEMDRLARLGYRILAVAERKASGRQDLTESRIDRLCFLGLVCIADPVRPTAAEAVTRLRRSGVDVMMITGDHPTTAEAIAAELNLLNGRIMTGAELDALPDEGLAETLKDVSVFARVSPGQKARVVQVLRAAGRVVAVTGDGANDAPAIRLADVGIALGERATPAARETADVVVTDDRIETITDAIADCRAMWRSTRHALAVLLGGNLGEIAFTVLTSLVSGSSPLNVRQLLLVNLLTDMLPAVALASRPPTGVTREELLNEGPDRSLGAALTRDIAVRAGATAGAAMAAWTLGRMSGSRAQADTIGLVALVGTQLAQTIVAGGRDPVVIASGLASLAALGVIVQVPFLSRFFGSSPLLPHGWAIALGCAGTFALGAVLVTRLPGGTLVAYVPGAELGARLAEGLRDGVRDGLRDGLPAGIAEALPEELAERVRTAWQTVRPAT